MQVRRRRPGVLRRLSFPVGAPQCVVSCRELAVDHRERRMTMETA